MQVPVEIPPSFQYGLSAVIVVLSVMRLARTLRELRGDRGRLDPRDSLAASRPEAIPCPDVLDSYPELRREIEQSDSSRRRRAAQMSARSFRWNRRRAFLTLLLIFFLVVPLTVSLLNPSRAVAFSAWLDRQLTHVRLWPPRYEGRPAPTFPAREVELAEFLPLEQLDWMRENFELRNRKRRKALAAEDRTAAPDPTLRVFSKERASALARPLSWVVLFAPLLWGAICLWVAPRRPLLLAAVQGVLVSLCLATFLRGGRAAGEVSGARAILEEIRAMQDPKIAPLRNPEDLADWVGPVKASGYPSFQGQGEDDVVLYERRLSLDESGREQLKSFPRPFYLGDLYVPPASLDSLEVYFGPCRPDGAFQDEGRILLGTPVLLVGLVVNREFSPSRRIILSPYSYAGIYDTMAASLRGRLARHRWIVALFQVGSGCVLLATLAAFLATMLELIIGGVEVRDPPGKTRGTNATGRGQQRSSVAS